MADLKQTTKAYIPWNKGKLPGQKKPLKLQDIWSIRVRLQLNGNLRDLAMFNLAIDSKLRGCDLVKLRVNDISNGSVISSRATVLQQKTRQPVQFEITKQTRDAITDWIQAAYLAPDNFLFFSRRRGIDHVSTRHYARIVKGWIELINLDSSAYGTHSLRRTKAAIIYRQTKNLRAVNKSGNDIIIAIKLGDWVQLIFVQKSLGQNAIDLLANSAVLTVDDILDLHTAG